MSTLPHITALLLTLSLLHTVGSPALCKDAEPDVWAAAAVDNVPAEVAYDHLYRQISYLDAKSREIKGQSGVEDSLRTFLKRQADLSDEQYRVVSGVAVDCERAAVLIDEKALMIIKALKLRRSVGREARVERVRQEFHLRRMQADRNDVILSGCDRLRKVLGEQAFTQFDNFVMRSVAASIARKRVYTGRGSAYGYTQLWYDRDAFMAIGYSATELDYIAQIYYDAYVEGYLYVQTGMVWAKGSDSSLGGHAATFTAAYVSPSSQYSFYSDHYVRAHQGKVSAADCQNCTRYYDPYCFSCVEPARPHRFALAQARNRAAQIDYNYIYLFSTRDTLATPNGLLPRAGESSFGMTLFAAVEYGKPHSNADSVLASGQAGSATAGQTNTERTRPTPIAAVDPNILELSVCPTADVAPGNNSNLAPLAEDVAQDGHYDVGKNLRFRLWLTSYGATPVVAWTGDSYYELRPQLMRDAESLPYKREVLSLTRAKENEPSPFGHAIVFRPGVPYQLNAIDLKDWYDQLGVGHYRLTILYRSHGSLSSNTVQFDISGDGSILKGGPTHAPPRQPAVPRP
jgi:hypothetical protein